MTFSLDETQVKAVSKFIKKQEKKTKGEYGTIGGGYTYSFTPTSLGVICVVKNCVTEEEINLTDFDSW